MIEKAASKGAFESFPNRFALALRRLSRCRRHPLCVCVPIRRIASSTTWHTSLLLVPNSSTDVVSSPATAIGSRNTSSGASNTPISHYVMESEGPRPGRSIPYAAENASARRWTLSRRPRVEAVAPSQASTIDRQSP